MLTSNVLASLFFEARLSLAMPRLEISPQTMSTRGHVAARCACLPTCSCIPYSKYIRHRMTFTVRPRNASARPAAPSATALTQHCFPRRRPPSGHHPSGACRSSVTHGGLSAVAASRSAPDYSGRARLPAAASAAQSADDAYDPFPEPLPPNLPANDLRKIVTAKITHARQLSDLHSILWNYGPELDHIHLCALLLQLVRLNEEQRRRPPHAAPAAPAAPPTGATHPAGSQPAAAAVAAATPAAAAPVAAAARPDASAPSAVDDLVSAMPSRAAAIIAAQVVRRTSRAAAGAVVAVAAKRLAIGDDPAINVPALARDAARLLVPQLPALSPAHVANCVYALGRLHHEDKRLFAALLAHAQPQLGHFTPQAREIGYSLLLCTMRNQQIVLVAASASK